MATPGQLMFARGLSPLARLVLWVVIGFSLIVIDVQFGALDKVRAGLSYTLAPVQRAVLIPFDVADEVGGFLVRHRTLQQRYDTLLAERVSLNRALYAARDTQRANVEMQELLTLTRRQDRTAVAAHILYQGQDWFSRRMTIDRGTAAGVQVGSPVIDARGLVGQVTRVYPTASEVTLVTNHDQLTPVTIERTGQRALLAGGNEVDQLELRFIPLHTDIKPGDVLLTSGIDKIYPPGLPVARVTRVMPQQTSPYAQVDCEPLAGVNRARVLLVLSFASGQKP